MIDGQFWTAIISSGRPHTVPKMKQWFPFATWYVGHPDEVPDYIAAGAESIVVAGGLVAARNAAIDDAQEFGLYCLQVDDDLTKLAQVQITDDDRKIAVPLETAQLRKIMLGNLLDYEVHLAGVAPTANPFFYNKPVHTDAFCVGDLLLISHETPLRFDPAFRLKEDYDYTLAHLDEYGRVARCNRILATFLHRKNPGGAVSYRTAAMEQEAIALLKHKWGDVIADNPRRENEILLRWKNHARQ